MKAKLLSALSILLIAALLAPLSAAAQTDEIPIYVPADEARALAQTGADSEGLSLDAESEVPQIRVTTENGNGTTLQKADGYVKAEISITDVDGSELTDSVNFKVRGNTTAMTAIPKKAFAFKFAKKKNVLGMGSGKKWALIASAFDTTLLRNYLTFELAYELGIDYTSNQKYVELWVDGSYRGCYILYEPVQAGKDRVDIDIDGNDGKKDFLIEYEAQRVEDDKTYFTVDGLRFIASEPEDPDEEQLEYITGTMQNIINVLKSGDEAAAREVIDLDSFAKFYLLNDFVKTYDFDMSSVFFYYKDGKLYAGPAWDYDLSAGNENSEAYSSRRIRDAASTEYLFAAGKNMFRYLSGREWFMDRVGEVYDEHFAFFTDLYAEGGLMDRTRAEYWNLFARNFAKGVWSVSRPWINIQKVPYATYNENFEFLRNWYKQRNEWLSAYFGVPYVLLGDADDDGEVNIVDATTICRQALSIPLKTKFVPGAADIDGDGEITVVDATFICRFDARISTPYPIGEKKRRTI